MELRRSSKGARTSKVITRSVSRYDIKARENAESPLLRLPVELKTRIYEYVCGGQTVHIDWRHRRFHHHLCKTCLSEEEAQKEFDASEEVWYARETADRHLRCCTDHYDCTRCTDSLSHLGCAKLDIRLLLCCRQLYLESNIVPYYANTFSFGSVDSLTNFCRLTPKKYRIAIRSLHVRLLFRSGGYYKPQDWHKAFKSVTTSLKALQRLHITIELFPYQYGEYPFIAEESILGDILQVGKLDLKCATVVLSDSHYAHSWLGRVNKEREKVERWTLAQKQEWSRYLRHALLHYEDRELELAKVKREALQQGRVCRL